MMVRCNHCGITTDRQPEGDLCHACSAGTMEAIKDHHEAINKTCPQCGIVNYTGMTCQVCRDLNNYGEEY